jgi:predicted metal-dependent enzyme (double-stranded beta helix superfamily)
MTATEYVLEDFVADLRRIVGASEDEATILMQVQPLARRFAGERSWLCEAIYGADPALGFGTTLLHVEADQSLFVVVDSWLPGRGVQPHDHDTWAVVVGVEGVERNIFWQRLDDGSRPGHAELRCIGERTIAPGESIEMPSASIHSVINQGERTSLSFHVYGRHLNHTARRRFDPERNLELPFIIDAR